MIQKTVLFLLLPPSGPLILMLAGLVLLRVRPLTGRLMAGSGFLLLYLLSLGPAADSLLVPLESYAPPLQDAPVKADAIVVLGGGVVDRSWAGLPVQPSGAALGRLMEGMRLYRKHRLPLVLMGGNGDPSRAVATDAETMARAARESGIPEKDLVLEARSRNTLEGARLLGKLMQGRRIILVTSAYHMRRAAGMFRKAGFQVVPAPTAYLAEKRKITPYSFLPMASSLHASSTACSEYLSLVWYRLSGALSTE